MSAFPQRHGRRAGNRLPLQTNDQLVIRQIGAEGLVIPAMVKLFLYAPDDIAEDVLLQCARAAAEAGECASIVVHGQSRNTMKKTVVALQALGLATLLRDCDVGLVHESGADGLHLSDGAKLLEARKQLINESLGFSAGVSRHAAMEAAEAGADYVAFAQTMQVAGEPIIGWWHDVAQIPSVAFDPVEMAMLPELLAQNPDFIRPSDDMWQSPEMAAQVIVALTAGGKA